MGVDVRPGSYDTLVGDVLFVRGDPVLRLVFAGKLEDPDQIEAVARAYRVRTAVGDSRPETYMILTLQRKLERYGIDLWRAQYNSMPTHVEMTRNEAEKLVKLDRTLTLDAVQMAFKSGLTVMLPQNFRDIAGGDFAREMVASKRIMAKYQRDEVYTWEHIGPDHAFHAFNYLMVATRMAGLFGYAGHAVMGAVKGLVRGRGEGAGHAETGDPAERLNWGVKPGKKAVFLEI